MRQLPRILLLFFFFLAWLFSALPAYADGACIAPRPDDPELKQAIKEAQKRGGAAALVNPNVLKAIYLMEAAVEYSYPEKWQCQRYPHAPSFVGLMSVSDTEYATVVPLEEQMNDIGVCEGKTCELSRCNIVDALEIVSRVLLDKIYIWDQKKDIPLGKLDDASDAYYASCRYYGTFLPDDITKNLVAYLPPEKIPADGQTSYCEFVTLYSGLYSNASQLPLRTDKPYSGMTSDVKFTFDSCGGQITPGKFDTHPLRPNPGEARPVPSPSPDNFLTTYCAMRPTPVEKNTIDLRGKPNGSGGRDAVTDLQTIGGLIQDFSKFVTPLLSITDQTKSDYSLPYEDKAQRYLADFLDGRAYYEPEAEPANPTPEQQTDLFNRLGVFRKLAPKTYQDQLKRAIIKRANNQFSPDDNPYGFPPASDIIQNYTVGFWQGKAVTLKDYLDNWAPLPNDPNVTDYAAAYTLWKIKDGGKWSALWPYVPMFSREDTKGTITIIDSNPPPDPWSPSGQWEEKNTSDKETLEVSHPHLARAYEVSTTLSYLLTPQAQHEAERPQLKDEWLPKMWELSSYWLDPSYIKPDIQSDNQPPLYEAGLLLGPLCDLDPNFGTAIYSSGDNALNDQFGTNVRRIDKNVPFKFLNLTQSPPINPVACVDGQGNTSYLNYECEQCLNGQKNESKCYITKDVRSNPDYLISYTPFLNQILTSTTLSGRGIFDIFSVYDPEKEKSLDQQYGWPGLGSEGEDSPKYTYSNGRAEAGVYKAGSTQSYYYRFLGTVQCAKERTLQVLQPFITGEQYKPFASACFPELAASPPPAGELVWPCPNAYILYTSSSGEDLAVCYEDPDRPYHKGLDLQCPTGQIFPSAPGTVVDVNQNPDAHGFGIYVIIDHHNGWFTLYAHLGEATVSVGDEVDLTTQIGTQDDSGSWSDGSHLHLGYSQSSSPDSFKDGGPTADPCKAISGCVCN